MLLFNLIRISKTNTNSISTKFVQWSKNDFKSKNYTDGDFYQL